MGFEPSASLERQFAEQPEPGCYPLDSSFPEKQIVRSGLLTQNESCRRWSFLKEEREARDGYLKGISTSAGNKKTNPLGPGQYDITAVQKFKRQGSAPAASIGRATRVTGEAPPGTGEAAPGQYNVRSQFDMSSVALAATGLSRSLGPRRVRKCHRGDAQQWSSMFRVDLPKRMQNTH